ncbi:MAG: hypothetical protein ACUVR2_12905 [Anaerolineae bacterium]
MTNGMDQGPYCFYLHDDPPPMLGIIIMSSATLVCVIGVLTFVPIGLAILFHIPADSLKGLDVKWGALILGMGLMYLAIGYVSWNVAYSLVQRRRNRSHIYLALTNSALIYQDYDMMDCLQKMVIPRRNIRAITFEVIPGEFEGPSSHLIRIHYLDEKRQKQYLDIDFFFGASSWPEGVSLMDILERELT